MRRDPERTRRRVALFGSLFMIALLVFSSVAYYYQGGDTTNDQTYNGYTFTAKAYDGTRGVWIAKMDGEEVEFQNLPPQVAALPYDASITPLLQNAAYIGITADPNVDENNAPAIGYDRLQFFNAWKKTFNVQTVAAEGSALPVMSCENASLQMPFIFLNVSNETSIRRDGNCIIVNGEQRGLLDAKDRLIFEYYGLLQNGVVAE
jgi:hypothetical protein